MRSLESLGQPMYRSGLKDKSLPSHNLIRNIRQEPQIRWKKSILLGHQELRSSQTRRQNQQIWEEGSALEGKVLRQHPSRTANSSHSVLRLCGRTFRILEMSSLRLPR